MLHFYPGLDPETLEEMPCATYMSLWKCITVIEARDMLQGITTSTYASGVRMKQETRNKIHRRLYDQAHPVFKKEDAKKGATTEDVAKFLRRRIGRGR